MRTGRRRLLAAALGAASVSSAERVLATPGRFETISVSSARLGRPLIASVWLPPGIDATAQPLPVLYLLHGARGNERSWPLAQRFWSTVEAGIEAGTWPPFIAICPGHFAGWWVDGPDGAMEQALIHDLIPAVEARYPVARGRQGRAVAGISAGGFGALRLSLRWPGLFGAATLWAPAVYADGPPERSAARMDAPFRGPDGQFNLATWNSLNWPVLLPGYLAQPLRVPMFIASGDHDPLNIALEAARLFASVWPNQPLSTELRVVDGDHSDRVWEQTADAALEFMFSRLKVETAQR